MNFKAQEEEQRIKREQERIRAEQKRNAAQRARDQRSKSGGVSGGRGGRVSGGGFAIMRTQKLKTFAQITGAGKHVQRLQDTPNADPDLLSSNRQLLGSGDLSADVIAYIESNVQGNIRKNAVLCIEQLLTASPEFFEDDPDGKRLDEWVNSQMQYIQKQWGANCVSAVLHLDEKTPHIHAHVVPVVNNKLNQKALIGGSKFRMRELQDEYAEAMKPLGLQRGIQKTKAAHQDIKSFYGQIQPMPSPEITVPNTLKNRLNPAAAFAEATAALRQELTTTKAQLAALQASQANSKKRAKVVNKIKENADKGVERACNALEKVKDDNANLRTINAQLINEQAMHAEQLALYQKYIDQIKEFEKQEQLKRERKELQRQTQNARKHQQTDQPSVRGFGR
jgi:Plasmid recombination enzyme.